MNDDSKKTLGAALIAIMVLGQLYVTWQIFQMNLQGILDIIPLLMGLNLVLCAVALSLYLRIFIGLQAYRPGKAEEESLKSSS